MSLSCIAPTQHLAQHILERWLNREIIPQAVLFYGPSGSGKSFYASHFSQDALCPKKKDAFACGICNSCKLWKSGTHPDIHVFSPGDKPSIGIETAKKIQEISQWKPVVGIYTLMILEDVHCLTTEAYNSLLKTVEEPSPLTSFIMTSSQLDLIPKTILSRSVRVPFHRLSKEKIMKLLSQSDANDFKIEFSTAFSHGSIIRTKDLLDEEKYQDLIQRLDAFVEFMTLGDASFPSLTKLDPESCIYLWSWLIREWYYLKLSSSKDSIITRDDKMKSWMNHPHSLGHLLQIQELLIGLQAELKKTPMQAKSNLEYWMVQSKNMDII